MDVDKIVVNKLREHSRLSGEDIAEIRHLRFAPRQLADHEDLIRQGDEPDKSVVVLSGWVARYHLLPGGGRQYLSFHMAGDWPDAQALFLDRMDHAVCAVGPAAVAGISHKELTRAITRRPQLGFAIWRETLIDASIFREAITNNSARTMPARMAHLFCELVYRARAAGLSDGASLPLPASLVQLGETLGMSIATVNRTLQHLRRQRAADLRKGMLVVQSWKRLAEIGQFNPAYLHLKKPPP
jgi:CRP-like cAMP-binding protein